MTEKEFILDKEKIEEILVDAQVEIRQSLIDQVKASASHAVGYKMEAEIQVIVEEFLTETIGKELKKQLLDIRPQVLRATAKAAKEIGDLLAESMVESVKENLSKSWDRDKIIKAILD